MTEENVEIVPFAVMQKIIGGVCAEDDFTRMQMENLCFATTSVLSDFGELGYQIGHA